MIKISFILPCYRVEKYIRLCLDSLYRLSLPLSEFEVLCFDDKGPDTTPMILDEYKEKYANFNVIHSDVNVGPGGGRNQMLAIAQGQYVWFVDGDDKIIPEMASELLQKAIDEKVDVLTFNYQDCDGEGNILPYSHTVPDSTIQAGRELADKVYSGGLVNNMGFPWRFMIRREYLSDHNIRFPESMIYGEDTVWMAKIVLLAERMLASSKIAYMYRHRDDSTCGALKMSYPGRTIFERTMVTSIQLLNFSDDLLKLYNDTDDELWKQHSINIIEFTKNQYINQLPILLSRSTIRERNVYYRLIRQYTLRNVLVPYANPMTRILMNPLFGPCVSACVAFIYKITHNAQ